ncbi:regulator of Vps4 activity in the MVB pathway-domain-containing protein [Phlebopus sp. FC_14]|nr:regulator of Vps4 activity in the MVB pathway-domain-containing protein [Phlebopus sp. FC_14]
MTSYQDPVTLKALLRQTSQRLGQLQEKKDSLGQIARRDIATLLQEGNVGPARAKAQNLLRDDALGDLLEVLEMHVGLILEHHTELDPGRTPTPAVVEAAASIILAAPSIESKDLNLVRDVLIQRFGSAFSQSVHSTHSHVSPRVTRILSPPPPSAARMDDCLLKIANAYGVQWSPEPCRQDIVNIVSNVLDPQTSTLVDLPRLRRLCSQGLPDDPPWIRPRMWRILFGTLPVLKNTWQKESQKQRESYYDLVRRLLQPLSNLPPPTQPLSASDATITAVSESLFRLPLELFSLLEDEPETSGLSPLDSEASDDVKVDCAWNLDIRLRLIRGERTESEFSRTPEIRLEPEEQPTRTPDSLASRRPGAPTTLLRGKSWSTPPAHQRHISALLRLLYIHSCLNPANQSPHIASLLVPLYSVLLKEVKPEEVAHAEADTFWLFEALVGELSEMEDQEGVKVWMQRFSERLVATDGELGASLHAKSLDPILPHYSYRWLAALLTQTLSLSSVFPVWDVIFACPMRTRDSNPKLECLVDICTGLLIHARTPLFRLGKPGPKYPGPWAWESTVLSPPSPLRPWELNDAFTEGMSLLQWYPIEAAGGIDRVLQTASDITRKRMGQIKHQKTENLTLGARLKATMWKGFTNQDEEDSHDDGNETETPAPATLTSRLANTVWRGITNQSSMEDETPSPPSPSSPSQSPSTLTPVDQYVDKLSPDLPAQTSLWSYADKLKDSDTIATFAKVSTNWRAKALDAWSRRSSNASSTLEVSSPSSVVSDLPPVKSAWPSMDGRANSSGNQRRGSLPGTDLENMMDPPRPAFFRSPRESFLPQPRRQNSTAPPSPEISTQSGETFLHRTKASLASLAASQTYSTMPVPPAKNGPRPLLLNSNTLMTLRSESPRSEGGTPLQRQGQWSDVLLAKQHMLRQESISSTSSLSPSEAFNRPYPRSAGSRSDYDSDTGSRRVPLNRKSVSPMALASRSPRVPWASPSSKHSSDVGISSPLSSGSVAEEASERGWRNFATLDSPTTISSPPIPRTPVTNSIPSDMIAVRVNDLDRHTGSISTSESNAPLEPPIQNRVMTRKKTPPPLRDNDTEDTSDSSLSQTPSAKASRIRSRKYAARPANLRIRDNLRPSTISEQRASSPNTLTPERLEEHDLATTPRAGEFGGDEPSSASTMSPRHPPSRKTSGDTNDSRLRKGLIDGPVRTRKVSTGSREVRRTRDSGAEEGDDEGYDDLLSAYESEEGSKE